MTLSLNDLKVERKILCRAVERVGVPSWTKTKVVVALRESIEQRKVSQQRLQEWLLLD